MWTDNFVHSDSTGNGRRYIYFTSTSNALTVRTNHKSNHGTVRGIKRVSQISDEEEDTIINKIGIVSETDDFLIYPNRISKVFNLLSVKESKYQIYSLNGLCVKNDYIIRGTNIIDISLLSPGAYILKIEDKDFKIIKE